MLDKLKKLFSKPAYDFEIIRAVSCKHYIYETYAVKYSALCKNTGKYINRIIYDESSITQEQLKRALDKGIFLGENSGWN